MGQGDDEIPISSPDAPEGENRETPLITLSPETPSAANIMLAEALIGEKIGARKLTFREQCGAFAALYAGVRNQIVARAFGVSLQCASKISGCLDYDPDPYRDVEEGERVLMDHNRNRSPNRQRHYETVAREFEALGKEEFNRRYYTERVHKRIILAKEELRLNNRLAKRRTHNAV